MFLILSQRIDYKSDYNDVPFRLYHYPKRYRNQIKTGVPFIYYQGDRYKKENRYYYGCGIVGDITKGDDGEHYFAKILNGIKFPNKVSIYNPDGGFYESIGYSEVRKKEKPSWQNSIRQLSESSFVTIIQRSGLECGVVKELLSIDNYVFLNENEKNEIKRLAKDIREQDLEDLIENKIDEEIDKIISRLDSKGLIEIKQLFYKIRKVCRKTITLLKELYNNTCQLCGASHFDTYRINVVEAHHIESFAETQNHQPENIVILCPTHHRLVHVGNAVFDRKRKTFIYSNGYEEILKKNKHL